MAISLEKKTGTSNTQCIRRSARVSRGLAKFNALAQSLKILGLREYNEINATMDLVLFEDAMKHESKVWYPFWEVTGWVKSLSNVNEVFGCNFTARQWPDEAT
eukprot:scaffold374_cov39-Cyclotella_meneghiniana.AAC.1